MSIASGEPDSDKAPQQRRRVTDVVLERPVLSVFLLALIVRVVAAISIWLIWNGTIFGDEGTYSEMATAVVEGRTGAWDDYTRWLYWDTATWTLPLTGIYALLTPNVLVGQLLSAAAGAAAAALTTRLAREALSVEWAVLAGLFVAFFPSQVLWSSLTLKDAAVWAVAAFVGLAVARVTVVRRGRTVAWALLLVISLVLMAFLRTHTFVVVTWAAALALAIIPFSHGWVRGLSAAALLVALPWTLGLGPAGLGFVLDQADTIAARRIANAMGASTAVISLPDGEDVGDPPSLTPGGSSTNEPGDLPRGAGGAASEGLGDRGSNPRGEPRDPSVGRADSPRGSAAPTDDSLGDPNLRHFPRGLVVMTLDPLPGMIGGNPRVRLAAAEHVIWYPLLVLAVVGLASVWGSRRVLAYPLLAGAGTTVVYALVEGNFGTAYRHRGEIVWVVSLLAAFGAHRLWTRFGDRQEHST